MAFGPIEDHLPIVIAELAPPFRVLTLSGKDKPEAGVDVAVEQRVQKTWYPGGSGASTQVLGVRHDPIVFRGWFHDPLTFADGGPAARVALARALVQGQNRCLLTWGLTINKWGRVSRFVPSFFGVNRIRYEITFDVDQANEIIPPGPLPIVASTLSDLQDAATAAVAAAEAATAVVDTVTTVGNVVT